MTERLTIEIFLFQEYKKQILNNGLWAIHSIAMHENSLSIEGWAIPPYGNNSLFEIHSNNVKISNIQKGLTHSVKKAFPFIDFDPGFRCTMNEVGQDSDIEYVFSFCNGVTGKPYDPKHNFTYQTISLPLPDERLRNRVHGPDLCSFELFGATFFKTLNQTLNAYFDRNFCSFETILDWGCGCGRIARLFSRITEQKSGLRFYGMDVDEENVAWCNENLLFGSFHVTPTVPPSPFKGDMFDLIYGISVFTHMGVRDQKNWLNELKRISRKDAIILMSVRGEVAASWFGWREGPPEFGGLTAEELHQWIEVNDGFLDCGLCNALDQIDTPDDYWRNVMHSKEYIIREWGRIFEIVDIVPGLIFGQDLVIMRNSY
jgi:SAM-dependent methyltransferase